MPKIQWNETRQFSDEEVVFQLKRFTVCFVELFENKINQYKDESMGKDIKPHNILKYLKFAGMGVGSIVGLASKKIDLGLTTKIGSEIGDFVGKVAIVPKNKAINATNAIYPITTEEKKVLKIHLVKIALQIFMSYEYCLMMILSSSESVVDLHLLVKDAVGRIMNFINKCEESLLESRATNFTEFILRGFIEGESKGRFGNFIPKDKIYIYFLSKEWSFQRLNRKLGLMEVGTKTFYKQNSLNDATTKFGFRILYDWENITEKNYEIVDISNSGRYNYVLINKDIEELGALIYEEICKKDVVLEKMDTNISTILNCVQETREVVNVLADIKEPIQFNMNPSQHTLCIGRIDQLKELHEKLIINHEGICIWGLKSIGKSHLARKYISEYKHFYNGNVVWIDCSNYDNFVASFMKLSKALNLPTQSEKQFEDEEPKQYTLKKIVENSYKYFKMQKCLIVFDNVTSYEEVKEFIPVQYKNIYVIITSTENVLGDNAPNLYLREFIDKEAMEFMVHILETTDGSDTEELKTLIRRLDNSPQNLNLAALCIKESYYQTNLKSAIMNYLSIYEKYERLISLEAPIEEEIVDPNIPKKFWKFAIDKILLIFEDCDGYKQILQGNLKEYRLHSFQIIPLQASLIVAYCVATDYILEKKLLQQDANKIIQVLSFLACNDIYVEEIFLGNTFSNYDKEQLWNIFSNFKKLSLLNIKDGIATMDTIVPLVFRFLMQKNECESQALNLSLSLIPSKVINGNFSQNMQEHIISIINHTHKYPEQLQEFIRYIKTLRNSEDVFLAILRILSGSAAKDLVIHFVV